MASPLWILVSIGISFFVLYLDRQKNDAVEDFTTTLQIFTRSVLVFLSSATQFRAAV